MNLVFSLIMYQTLAPVPLVLTQNLGATGEMFCCDLIVVLATVSPRLSLLLKACKTIRRGILLVRYTLESGEASALTFPLKFSR